MFEFVLTAIKDGKEIQRYVTAADREEAETVARNRCSVSGMEFISIAFRRKKF